MNITFVDVMWVALVPLAAAFVYLCYLEFRHAKPCRTASIIVGIFALWMLASLFRPVKAVDGFEVKEFGSLPVLLGGRIQPMQSIARNSLLSIRGKSAVALSEVKWWERFPRPRPG